MPHGPGANPSSAPAGADVIEAAKVEVPPQGFEGKGYQACYGARTTKTTTISCSRSIIAAKAKQNWRLLKDKLTQKFYSWDTTSMPDGAYYLKIVATDSPSNPAGQALSTERESDRFEIANTPPRIENLRADASGATVKISFVGISSFDAIGQAQYSLDAGDWQIVLPAGQLSDAPKESYQFEIPAPAPGEHVVAVQITDGFNNTTAAKVSFQIPTRGAK